PQGDVRADGLLAPLVVPAGRPAAGLLARPGVPADARRGGRAQPERVRAGARPPVPVAEAVGGAPLLRARGAAGADPRRGTARGAVRGLGARGAGLGGRRAAVVLRRLLPARRLGRGE